MLVTDAGMRLALERIYLGAGNYSEAWLQELIQRRPDLLPIADIEPGFGMPVPVGREVPCERGFIDNLYLTPSGDIVLVETKLWRSSEMRREVVAQTLDYVSALTAMSYDDLERALYRAVDGPVRIYDFFRDNPEALEEERFIDAVSNNLKRGRMLAIVLGDGIRSETEALAELLQSHAGAHFTFALVEIATYRTPEGHILAIPDVLAKTVMIERGVVRVIDGAIVVEPVPAEAKPRAQSISMQDFMGLMALRDPNLPALINGLIDALEPLGIYPELKASLSFKADFPELSGTINFGYITKDGKFWTDTFPPKAPEHVWKHYFEELAAPIGGTFNDGKSKYLTAATGSAPYIDQLLPDHFDRMVLAIENAVRALRSSEG